MLAGSVNQYAFGVVLVGITASVVPDNTIAVPPVAAAYTFTPELPLLVAAARRLEIFAPAHKLYVVSAVGSKVAAVTVTVEVAFTVQGAVAFTVYVYTPTKPEPGLVQDPPVAAPVKAANKASSEGEALKLSVPLVPALGAA